MWVFRGKASKMPSCSAVNMVVHSTAESSVDKSQPNATLLVPRSITVRHLGTAVYNHS